MANPPNRGLSVRCPLCGASIGAHCRFPIPGDYRSRGGEFPEPSVWQGSERRPHRARTQAEDALTAEIRAEHVRLATIEMEERARRAAEEGRNRRADRLAHSRLHPHHPRKGEPQ